MKTNLLTLLLSGILLLETNAQVVVRQTTVTTTYQYNPWGRQCGPEMRPVHSFNRYPVVAAPVPLYHNRPACMNPEQFSRVLHMISSQHFDSSRLQVANQVASSNTLTSEQVAAIMHVFSFESTRLEFARNAYYRVIDPQNYFLVNNAFRFSSSIDDLYDYIM